LCGTNVIGYLLIYFIFKAVVLFSRYIWTKYIHYHNYLFQHSYHHHIMAIIFQTVASSIISYQFNIIVYVLHHNYPNQCNIVVWFHLVLSLRISLRDYQNYISKLLTVTTGERDQHHLQPVIKKMFKKKRLEWKRLNPYREAIADISLYLFPLEIFESNISIDQSIKFVFIL